jgi:hypothetical protein
MQSLQSLQPPSPWPARRCTLQRIRNAEGRRRVKARPADLPRFTSLPCTQPIIQGLPAARFISLSPFAQRSAHHFAACRSSIIYDCRAYRKCAAAPSAHSAMHSKQCSGTATASADDDTALSARLPSPNGGTNCARRDANSGTTLPWLINPRARRSFSSFDGLSRQSADGEQTIMSFPE